MKHWLMKSEPSVFGIDDLKKAPKKRSAWDGVRTLPSSITLAAMSLEFTAFAASRRPAIRITQHLILPTTTLIRRASLTVRPGTWWMLSSLNALSDRSRLRSYVRTLKNSAIC